MSRNALLAVALFAVSALAPHALADDPAARRLLGEAQRLERSGDVDGALREYRLLVDRFPADPVAEEAQYSMAAALYGRGDSVPARQTADELIASKPRSPWAAAAYVLEGRMLTEHPSGPDDLESARALLRRVPLLFGPESYPELAWRTQARVLAGEIGLHLGQYPQAAGEFLGAIEDEPPSEWTARARLGLATVFLADGEWTAAAGELERTVEAGGVEAAVARQRLGAIHRLQVRPAAGQAAWQKARLIPVPGTELRKPSGVAAENDGSVVVGDRSSDTVYRLAPDGSLADRLELTEPGRPWAQEDGVYLPSGDTVTRLGDRSAQSFVAPRGKKLEPVKDLDAGVRGTLGQWYLLDHQSKRVLVFVPTGRYLATLAEGDPVDVAQDPRGRIYVLDRKRGDVTRFATDGSSEGVFVHHDGRRPEALEIDDLGDVYILDRDSGRISVYDPGGQLLATLGPQLPGGIELKNPVDLAVDGAGRVIVLDGKQSAPVVIE
ncbi:MAG: tetratricopeptide repeat protein [Acidobacteria bacterium]|nr:tetratricopeptide repeat protein [Acidobacteriota bacterium]